MVSRAAVILIKMLSCRLQSQSRQENSRFSTFSPTLARLLTAPEKVVAPNALPTSTTSTPYTPQKVSTLTITINVIT